MTEYSDNAIAIYKRLYFDKLKNEKTPSNVHGRIAEFIGNGDEETNTFFELLESNKFRPNSPCMINAGSASKNPHDRALSACYVLGLEDSMDSIIEMWGICAKIYASGAGSGIPITNLREKGGIISTGGQASGPLAYLSVVDLLSNTVRSGGKTRRAANMGVFKYDHPDVIEILDSKLNGGIQTFNLSMSVTDKFMKNRKGQVHLISPSTGKLTNTIDKEEIWKKVINNAWTNGDPGLFFFDTVNRFNPFPSLGDIDCTNPCGEVPLPPWSVCNIGSINVSQYVRTQPGMADEKFTPFFDWTAYRNDVEKCFLFLDRVINKQDYIDVRFEKNARVYRPVGLGIMGFADALIKLEIPYCSVESIGFFEELCYELTKHCIVKSLQMSMEGMGSVPVPSEDYTHFRNLLKYYLTGNTDHISRAKEKNVEELLQQFDETGIHNSNWTMIAPTGSTSMSADCSYAWEPLMALVWEKPLVESDEVLKIIDPQFEMNLDKLLNSGYFKEQTPYMQKTKEEVINDIIENKGSIQNLSYLPDSMKKIYKVAHDISPMAKITMQSEGQKWISMAISSTVNLPNHATKEEVEAIYLTAWEYGLKGITVFRDGCRDDQIVHFGKKEEKRRSTDKKIKRPIRRDGSTVEIKTPHGKFFVTVNYHKGKPIEMFFSVGKQGGLVNVIVDALARICSKGLQAGMTMEWIIDTLEGLSGQSFWFKIDESMERSIQAESIVDALSKVLAFHFTNYQIKMDSNLQGIKVNQEVFDDVMSDFICKSDLFERCPECGKRALTHTLGCRGGECLSCGFTNCS